MRPSWIATLVAAAVVAGCSGATEPPHAPALLTGLPRALSPNETHVAAAANQFTLSLFRRLNSAQPDSNVFVSPLSVSFSLGMALNGANGTTLDQMRTALGLGGADIAGINGGYRSLMALEDGLDPTTTFTIANSVWYRHDFPVLASFTDTVKSVFAADVRPSLFDAATVDSVNAWVTAKTRGKIPRILDAIDSSDVMFLLNAIYFKGTWREQFDPALTRPGTFQSLSGPQTVSMMSSRETTLRMTERPSYLVGDVPYGNGAFVMTLLLPQNDATVAQVAAQLDSAEWNAATAQLRDGRALIGLPRFKVTYERTLNDDLKTLGMILPFEQNGADFTRMSPQGRQLYIAFVKHKAFVDVNEEGTEAAAVTNTGIEATAMPPCLCMDRPFIFVIRERFSGTILFIGKIVRIPA